MTQLLFIRHAETNLAGRFCGHIDPPLNERGLHQIAELLGRLEGLSFTTVCSSDLLRAKATAEQISLHFRVPHTIVPGLQEIYFGAWEGLQWSEIEQWDAAYAQQWLTQYPQLSAPGGEGFADFRARVLTKVAQLAADPDPGCAAVVTHAGVMRVVLQELCGKTDPEAWEMTRSYCCSFVYDIATQRCEVIL